jgi:hypothetical protein
MATKNDDAGGQYSLLMPLLSSVYDEMKELSKKNPDGPINEYKSKNIARILSSTRELLKSEKSLEFLDEFDDDVFPTNSDVVILLGQYIKALGKFYDDKIDSFRSLRKGF